MHSTPMTTLLRSFSSRRGILTLFVGLFGAMAPHLHNQDVGARKKGKRKKKRKHKNNKDKKPKTRVDAVCSRGGGRGGILVLNAETSRIAQTFTAGGSGSLVRAELLIDKEAQTFGDYVVQLGTVDDFGVPTDEVLASTSVGNPAVPDGESTVTFTFAKPASVTAGVQYALILARPGTTKFSWSGSRGDPCAGRAFTSGDVGEPFRSVDSELDLTYATFIRS